VRIANHHYKGRKRQSLTRCGHPRQTWHSKGRNRRCLRAFANAVVHGRQETPWYRSKNFVGSFGIVGVRRAEDIDKARRNNLAHLNRNRLRGFHVAAQSAVLPPAIDPNIEGLPMLFRKTVCRRARTVLRSTARIGPRSDLSWVTVRGLVTTGKTLSPATAGRRQFD